MYRVVRSECNSVFNGLGSDLSLGEWLEKVLGSPLLAEIAGVFT